MLNKAKAWHSGLSKVGKVSLWSITAVIFGSVIASAASKPSSTVVPNTPFTASPTAVKSDVVETKTLTTTEAIPFSSSMVSDSSLAKDTTVTKIAGANGVNTKTWTVTYTNGIETGRKLVSENVTTPPVNEVKALGTYVAPSAPAPNSCPNGTYVNTAGNTVCSPYEAPTAPAGATAKCGDGTYSFSQSHSGTCSHHGGVAEWL